VAPKNLGAILGKEGDSLKALFYLRRSYEVDPKTSRRCTASPSAET